MEFNPWDFDCQKFYISAWVQVNEGSETVSVVFKINKDDMVPAGSVIAKRGCWTLLKGGIVANFSSPADILFEVKNSFLT